MRVQTAIGLTAANKRSLTIIMRQRHFPGSLTDWVSPFCAACYFIHPPTSFISLFGEVMLAAALSKQETSLSGLAATSDTLLSAAGPTFCGGVSRSYTYDKTVNAAQLAVSGWNWRG